MLDHENWRRAIRQGGADALLIWFRLRAWCARRLTDGRVPADMVDEVGEIVGKTRAKALQALVESRLVAWCGLDEDAPSLCRGDAEPSPRQRQSTDELVVVGYLKRNPSRASVLSERERRAKTQRDYADRKKLTGQQPVALPEPDPVALPPADNHPSQSRPNPVPSPDPIPHGSSAPLEVVRSLKGVEFKREWRQAALMASVAPEHIDGFWETLCTGPIGGKRGVLPDELDRYVLGQIQREWPKWSEQKRAESRVSPLRPVARTRRDEINQTMLRELDELRANEAANEGA